MSISTNQLRFVHPCISPDLWLEEVRCAWRRNFPRKRSAPLYLYAIQSAEDGPIKLGIAQKPWERIATLRTASPFPLRGLAAWRASVAEEKALHELWAEDRLEGEWFKPSVALLAFVDLFGGGMSVDCAFFKPERCLSQRSLDLGKELMGMGTCEACGMEFPEEERWDS